MTLFCNYRLKGVKAPLKTKIKWFWQRLTRGFDDTELWNLDNTIAEFVLPRLKAFRNYTKGFPVEFNSLEEWQEAIDKMIFFFENIIDDEWFWKTEHTKEELLELEKKMHECLELFCKNYSHLWY